MALNITPREAWLAQPSARTVVQLRPPVHKVFLMNSRTKPCRNSVYCQGVIRRIQNFHTEIQRNADIRYNFIIGGDGSVYEGRGWEAYPELPRDYKTMNNHSISICYIGPYSGINVPKIMADKSRLLVEHGVHNGLISEQFELQDITIEDKPATPEDSEDIMLQYM